MLGFKTRNRKALADMRVGRGVKLFDANADHGWQRHLLDVGQDRKLHFRGRADYTSDRDGILALVFEDYTELARDTDGCVTDMRVMDELGLTDADMILNGFYADSVRDPSPEQFQLTLHMRWALEKAWLEALTTYARPPHTPHAHESVLRRRLFRQALSKFAAKHRDQLELPRGDLPL